MKKALLFSLLVVFTSGSVFTQDLPELKLINKKNNVSLIKQTGLDDKSFFKETIQLKKRKTVNTYFGAGYSFIIFTNSSMNSLYPLLDTRNGTFLTDINLFFGFALGQAVALEFEPSFLFTSSSKTIVTNTGIPHTQTNDTMAYSSNIGMFAIPIT